MPKIIECSKGKHAVVDDENYEWLSGYKWWAQTSGSRKTWYAYSRMGKKYSPAIAMHRAIMGLKPGEKGEIDHINGDGLDNQKTNLRYGKRWQNHANAGRRKHNTTGFKCIELNIHGNWSARITANGKRKHLGTFKTREEAAYVYDQASRELHGEFAQTNHDLGLLSGEYDGSIPFDQLAEIKEIWDHGVSIGKIDIEDDPVGVLADGLREYISALEARIAGLGIENRILKDTLDD